MDARENLLQIVSGITGTPEGAYNIRENAGLGGRRSTRHIVITGKEDKPGIDIHIKSDCRGETCFIPAIITHEDVHDLVYNDFYVEDGAVVTIVAGCGVHNDGCGSSEHNGIHRFFVGADADVKYVEKHIGTGGGSGKRIINPRTYIELGKGSTLTMETTQIEGVDSTVRESEAILGEGAKLIIKEKIMTSGQQYAETRFKVDMNGDECAAHLVSRSVAKGDSSQKFVSVLNGNAKCTGHSECDAIIMENGKVTSLPEVTANSTDAMLIHEAAIGKIAGEQIVKLMTLGLSENEAEEQIIRGFLK
ncbi:MAG: SufD family Fe-S cluster assembly protein [Eubacteriales bacterium]|nr:SufD family Fe-S cluster assembly protein [Eubacteriales bacterium]